MAGGRGKGDPTLMKLVFVRRASLSVLKVSTDIKPSFSQSLSHPPHPTSSMLFSSYVLIWESGKEG